MKYGARHLKRAIEKNLVYPMASLLATDQVRLGDVIAIDWNNEHGLTFMKETESARVPVESQPAEAAAIAVGAEPDERAIPLVRTFVAAERQPPRSQR